MQVRHDISLGLLTKHDLLFRDVKMGYKMILFLEVKIARKWDEISV